MKNWKEKKTGSARRVSAGDGPGSFGRTDYKEVHHDDDNCKDLSDGKPIETLSIGEMDESRARALVIHKIQKDLMDCTLSASFTHIVNRQRYVLLFFDPIRIDFVDFVNKLFNSRPTAESISQLGEQA